MSEEWDSVVQAVHQRPQMFVLTVTGGGSGAVGRLLRVPGASRTLLEARVPYAAAALTEWLGRPPERACCRRTALQMASKGWLRAGQLLEQEQVSGATTQEARPWPVGVSCTASLASDRPKRGEHRCWLAAHDLERTRCYHLVLEKGARTRQQEEELVEQLVLKAVAEACDLSELPDLPLRPEEQIEQEEREAEPLVVELAKGERSVVWRLSDGRLSERPNVEPVGLLCGAFDPLHAGHQRLRAAAEQWLQGPVFYELTLFNADKPPLDYLTLEQRCRQFDTSAVLTRAGTFVEKSAVLPGKTFVVGFDTAERILQPRFYGHSVELMYKALEQLRERGCRFLVAGRLVSGRFHTVADLAVPAKFRELFVELPETLFREDISSTDLRRQALKDE